ncbi:MAG: hypothetical protein COW65_04820 [Cytophagales bacterium CG18_big_fil_WC_8_21_14_2_50_42_9]|nr:MAG: hypothetical protein COW65_04820 [Cytophagales bacterium CG18_big_fil_WC_8_21_14_2_50_42_9]
MIPEYTFLLLLGLFLAACESRQANKNAASAAPESNPQTIINQAIAAHGGEKFENLNLSFDFRDKHYTAQRNKGLYTYTRSFTDSTGQVKDILTNHSFTRTINGQVQKLPAERVKAFTSSVNSVIYFALLPFGLNDLAVRKEFLGSVTINKIAYYKIKVGFNQEGGGEDYQDHFLYWINQQSGTMDYLAYTFATDGGGIRFRQAINPQTVDGIRFQHYINYEPQGEINFLEIDKLFAAGKLKELSRIELKNLRALPL